MICGAGPRPAAASQAGLCSSPSAGTTVFPHSAPFRPPIRLPAKPSSPWAAGSITLAAAPPFPDRRPGRSSSRLRSNTERKSGTTSCTRGRSCPIASLSSSLLRRAYRSFHARSRRPPRNEPTCCFSGAANRFGKTRFRRIQRYIEGNPVTALLAARTERYAWSSAGRAACEAAVGLPHECRNSSCRPKPAPATSTAWPSGRPIWAAAEFERRRFYPGPASQ